MLNAIAMIGIGASKFSEFFEKWFPGIVWKYQVKAQGGPTTPNRDVLHAALAAVFGMSSHKTFSTIEVTAIVDHNNNSVVVTYSVIVNGTSMVLGGILGILRKDAAPQEKKGQDPNNPANSGFNNADARNILRAGGNLSLRALTGGVAGVDEVNKVGEWLGRQISNTWLGRRIRANVPHQTTIDAEKNAIATEAIYQAELAKQKAEKEAKQQRKVNPGLLPKIPPDNNVNRGIFNGAAPQNPALPWIITRQVSGVLGLPSVQAILRKQQVLQTYETGARSVFELSAENVYAGDMPTVFTIGQVVDQDGIPIGPEPFRTMVVANGEAFGTPFLTRSDDVNPQLPQAMGVDLKTLVAQVLFDPGTWPPQPKTEQGPPTIVSNNFPQFPS